MAARILQLLPDGGRSLAQHTVVVAVNGLDNLILQALLIHHLVEIEQRKRRTDANHVIWLVYYVFESGGVVFLFDDTVKDREKTGMLASGWADAAVGVN